MDIAAEQVFFVSLETIDFDFTNVHHAYNLTQPAVIKAKNNNHTEVHIFLGQNSKEVFCQLRTSQRSPVHSRAMATKSFGKVRVMPPVGSLLAHERSISKERLRKFLNGYLAYRHFRNQLWEKPSEYRRFKELLENTWNGLVIQHFENDHGDARNEYSLLVREGRFTSEISWHGHGLQAWMQTVWFLARNAQDATIVLDEPDVYLHADLQRKLIKLIESLRFNQAIIATHSSEIIGDVPFNHVTVVQKRDRTSRPAAKADEIQAALKSMGSLHSIQLAKVASHGLLFFVEGDDKPFLTDVAYKLGPRKFDAFSSMAIQEIQGKGNWKHAIGASKALSLASSGEIKTALLLDQDFMLDSQISDYHGTAQKYGLILKIWSRKEIENYFICPKAIARFISERSSTHVSDSEIEKFIDEIEISIRSDLELSIADVIQDHSRKGISPKTSVTRAKELVSRRLEQGGKIREMAGGKDLFSKLSFKCKENYGVSFSPLTICKIMRLDEYPDELVDLVEALSRPENLTVGQFIN